MAQQVKNPTSIHEDAGSIPGLAQCIKGSRLAVSFSIGHRRGSNLALLWLWCRPAAAAQIQPLARKRPYAAGADIKNKKKNVEVMMESGRSSFCHHHESTDSGKDQQEKLNPLGEGCGEQDACVMTKPYPPDCFSAHLYDGESWLSPL